MASLLEEPMNVIDILRISYLAAAAFVSSLEIGRRTITMP